MILRRSLRAGCLPALFLLAAPAAAQTPPPEAATVDEPLALTEQALDALVRRELAAADLNRDGWLDLRELGAATGGFPPRQPPGLDLVDWIRWQRTDLDRDGRIAPEDVIALYTATFEDLDRDADGVLTPAERRASMDERHMVVCVRDDEACARARREQEARRAARARSGRLFDRLDWWARRYYRFGSGIDAPLYGAVRDYRSWHALWDRVAARHRPKPPSPSVDFSKDMVLVAATGTKPSGGYSISIVSVHEAARYLVATAVRTSPGPRCGTTAALTAPADIVRVPASAKPVRWTFVDRVSDCP